MSIHSATGLRGRGSASNPVNRFVQIDYSPDPDIDPPPAGSPTRFYVDNSRSILAFNDSPDIPFRASLNPYRGCEHGCIYCYARPGHEYLGLSSGLDFETKIFVKQEAPALLEKALSAKKWQPQTIALSGATDPYQPAERTFQLTRRCLQVLARFRNPVGVITKNFLVTRDIDILGELAASQAVSVAISITTLDRDLARKMEPRTSSPDRRLEAIHRLHEANIPVMVMVAPVIPGLNDHEIPSIIQAATEAGATQAGYVMLRLPYSVSGLFENWLEMNYPGRKEKVLSRIRTTRGGKLNVSEFHSRMRGEGPFAAQAKAFFTAACRKAGILEQRFTLSASNFRRVEGNQLSLFQEEVR